MTYENASTESLELFRETMLETLAEVDEELKYRKLAEEKSFAETPEVDSDSYVRLEGVVRIIEVNTQFFRNPPVSGSELIALLIKLPKKVVKEKDEIISRDRGTNGGNREHAEGSEDRESDSGVSEVTGS